MSWLTQSSLGGEIGAKLIPVTVTDAWRKAHPEAAIGLLELSDVDNAQPSAALEARKREVQEQLRSTYRGFDRGAFLELPALAAYKRYYRKFKKTYHLQLQIESIVLHEKRLPTVSPLVDSNFIAEMETFVLTAGHDVAKLVEPVLIDVSHEGDTMSQLDGGIKALRAGDMVMRDREGICCSILYGQDNRSPLSAATNHVVFVSYAPPGVSPALVTSHLQTIETYVHLFSTSCRLEQCQVLLAG